MGNQPYIVGVGAANLDLNGASCAPIHLRDSNPGHISLSAGGVTRNVCENLARLGADVKLLSCVGDDVFGSYIRRSCVEAGIDIRYLHEAKGAHSSIYLSILDADGDMLVGMSDMRIVQQDLPADYLPSQKQLIQGAKVVTCDPCMGETALLQLLGGADDELRATAAWALGHLPHSDEAVTALISALEDPYEWTVRYAVEALGNARDPRAAEPLERLLSDERQELADLAKQALGLLSEC